MNQADKEWFAIMFYTNKTYRKTIITESRRLQVYEGLTDAIKNAWTKAKEKAEMFLDSFSGAGDLITDSFFNRTWKIRRRWEANMEFYQHYWR
jgi:hypothetical protein